jgi:hypothetical protein
MPTPMCDRQQRELHSGQFVHAEHDNAAGGIISVGGTQTLSGNITMSQNSTIAVNATRDRAG